MFIDKELLLSGSRSTTGVWTGQTICNAASEYSTNTIDLGAAKNLSKGKQLYVVVIIPVEIDTVTSVDFQVVTDDSATLAASTVQASTGAILQASLTAGRAPIVIPVGSALGVKEQYLGMYYVIPDSNYNVSGTVIAFVAFDIP